MANENDNKLVNLADLKAAFDEVNDKAGVTSVNGQTGAVSITPADIGAVNKAGDSMTGGINFVDSNSNPVGGVSYIHDTNGADRTYLIARAIGTGNLQLGVKRNGDDTLEYWINNPSKFLSALGLKSVRIEAGTPMDNGQVDLGLSNNKIPLSAWSTGTVCQFYVKGSTATWCVRLSDRITGAVISGTTTPIPINVTYIDR